MSPIYTTLLAAIFAYTGVASVIPTRIGIPADSTSVGKSFSVEQVRNTAFKRRYGPLALAKAYIKYGAEVPSDVQGAVARIFDELGLEKRVTGSVEAVPVEYDTEYLCPVEIGTPPQLLMIDFDTGSSDFWVFSSTTPTSQVRGQTVYKPGSSNTAEKLTGATWSIRYGDGSTSRGEVYTDKVTIGNLTVTQAVEVASTVSSQFTADAELDGLLGLAHGSLNTVRPTQQKTFFDNIRSTLDAPVFAVDLKAKATGKYDFGFIDQSAYTGSIAYTPVDTSDGFWMWTSPGYAVGSDALGTTKITGIADTGTTLALLPSAVVTAYYKKVSGARYDSSVGGYIFSCSTTVPDFTFGVGTAKITIPGKFINFAPVDRAETICFGGIQSDTGIGFSIWGDVALKAAFVVFDAGNERLGWAAKKL